MSELTWRGEWDPYENPWHPRSIPFYWGNGEVWPGGVGQYHEDIISYPYSDEELEQLGKIEGAGRYYLDDHSVLDYDGEYYPEFKRVVQKHFGDFNKTAAEAEFLDNEALIGSFYRWIYVPKYDSVYFGDSAYWSHWGMLDSIVGPNPINKFGLDTASGYYFPDKRKVEVDDNELYVDENEIKQIVQDAFDHEDKTSKTAKIKVDWIDIPEKFFIHRLPFVYDKAENTLYVGNWGGLHEDMFKKLQISGHHAEELFSDRYAAGVVTEDGAIHFLSSGPGTENIPFDAEEEIVQWLKAEAEETRGRYDSEEEYDD